jgi:hypothetical protein
MSGALTAIKIRNLTSFFKSNNFLKPKDNLFLALEPLLLNNAYVQLDKRYNELLYNSNIIDGTSN